MEPMPLLAVRGLSLRRAGRDILRGVRLEVRPGEMHGLLGLNGSGKSSLAYALMGCAGYAPDAGTMHFNGRDLNGLTMTERARLGLTLAWQEPARIEGLTVERYLAAGMRERREDRMQAALEAVGLHPARYIRRTLNSSLSGGERKRIELAAVYAMQPRLAILDEPDSGIDVLSLADITALIRRMAAEGTSVLVITHRDELTEACDTASLMCEGAITVTGEPDVVRAHYRTRCRPCDILLARQGPDRTLAALGPFGPGGEREGAGAEVRP
jgi:Fe-S cluster assembly ATP-binding protein